jgi:hypothetical protein
MLDQQLNGEQKFLSCDEFRELIRTCKAIEHEKTAIVAFTAIRNTYENQQMSTAGAATEMVRIAIAALAEIERPQVATT